MNMTSELSETKLAQNFDPTAKSFNAYNMAYLAYCAQSVYQSDEQCKDLLRELDPKIIDNLKFFHRASTGTEGFITNDEQKIILAFRGTSATQDWLTDAMSIQKTWTSTKKIGKVHSGFYKSLNSVWSEIMEHLQALRTKNQPIWITGHSLGGALAALAFATLRLQEPKYEVAGAYTFGQPRVGNDDFTQAFDADAKHRLFRLVNNNDIVPRLPSTLIRKGVSFATLAAKSIHDVDSYEHMGQLLYFDADGKLNQDATFLDMAKGRFEGYVKNLFNKKINLDSVEDHSMKTYRQLSINAIQQ